MSQQEQEQEQQQQQEEESSDESDFLADWGQGDVPLIIPLTDVIITELLGLRQPLRLPITLPLSPPRAPSIFESPPRRVRLRPEEAPQQSIPKRRRGVLSEIVKAYDSLEPPAPNYNYLKLKSGREFFFKSSDGEKLLTRSIEPNLYVRKLLTAMPVRISERLHFFADFLKEESGSEDICDTGSEEEQEKQEQDDSKEAEEADEADNEYQEYDIDLTSESSFELPKPKWPTHPDRLNLRDKLYTAYIRESRLKYAFRKLLILWRAHRLNARYTKDVDPITLSEPEKEIVLYNWPLRKKFVLDARSLSNLIESKLAYQEYGFPVPQYPVNPSTNIPFAYNELTEIFTQLKAHGELQWGFATLRKYNFNKQRWHMYHKSALTVNAIRTAMLALDTHDGRELLSDFIFAKMDELQIFAPNTTRNAYLRAIVRDPNNWYLDRFKAVAMQHYEAEHFGYNKALAINNKCLQIFRKQSQFIKELRDKQII
jgi:hypothetical protein